MQLFEILRNIFGSENTKLIKLINIKLESINILKIALSYTEDAKIT